jgi:hypothetical protein
LLFVIGSLLIGYLATTALVAGADYMAVFRHVFVASFIACG